MDRFGCFRKLLLTFGFLLTLMLAGCGGGGGGGGAAPNPGGPGGTPGTDTGGFSVSIDRTELKFSAEEGQTLTPQVVLGSGTGTPPSIIYTGSLDLGTALDRVTVEVIGVQVKFTVYAKSNLAPGQYQGSLQLFACADDKCAKHFAGSPVTVPYTITITKGLTVTPASVALAAKSGATASANVSVQLPTGQATYDVRSSATWLVVSNVTPSGFAVTGQALPPGSYSGTVSVSTPGRNRDVSVAYTVSGDGSTVTSIIPDVSSLSFTTLATTTPASRTINVTLPSWATELNVQVNYSGSANGWLSLVRLGDRSYIATASAAALAAGSYRADIVFSSGNFTSPVTVPVSFTVGAANWSVAGVTGFTVAADATAASLASDIAIDLPGLPAQTWSASSTAAWLKLGSTSGTTGGKLHVSVDTAEMLKLANFKSYSADVNISAADSRIAPAKLTFTLTKALPELNFVSPHTRLPGEGGVYTLRGRGFDNVAKLQQALQVSGATPLAITRVNDTELSVQLPGAASGSVTFAVANALGVATGAPQLQVVPPPAFSYRAVATQGGKGGIVFDPERQSIYSVNKTLGAVMRFAYNGSGWDVSSAALPSADWVAISPDGKSLVATAKSGNIVLLDPSSLAIQGTYSAGTVGGYEFNSDPLLAVTNNGKAFFQGSTWASGLGYFDLTTRQFGSISGNMRFDFYSGPWFSISGDGSRLNIVQSASITPTPSALYMNASDESPKVNPAGLTFWYESAQSLHGERFVEGTYKVWDRDFNLIGNIVLPDSSYFGRTPVLSPDGARVYILAYNLDSAGAKPRVYVFDSSTRLVTTTNLPVLGYFTLPDYPTCAKSDYYCNTRALGTISPDGKTLFFIGDTNLVVAPIPALTATSQPVSIQRARAGSGATPSALVGTPVRQWAGG